MKLSRKKRTYYPFIVSIAIILLGIGSIMMLQDIKQYLSYTQSTEAKELLSIARSADRTMDSIFDKNMNELNYVVSRRGFMDAEKQWYENGDAHHLLECMNDNLLKRESTFITMTASFKGKIFLSTNGITDYYIPDADEITGYQDIMITSDSNETPYLAFLQKKDDIVYSTIMDIKKFYSKVESTSGLRSLGNLMVLDKNRSVFVHLQEGRIQSQLLINEGDTDAPLPRMLINSQESGKERTIFYNYEDAGEPVHTHNVDSETEQDTSREDNNSSNSVRIALLPASASTNGLFSIGIIKDSREEMAQLKHFSFMLLAYGSMILIAIILLLFCIRRYSFQEQRNLQEIKILQEKKAAMEELNRETLELAHHQRLETIGQLTSGIAHDFNNLLTPMMGYSLMVMEKLPPEDTESYDNLLEIYNASSKAKKLISRLSDLSRKNTVTTMKLMNPDHVIGETLSMMEPARPKNVELIKNFDCQKPCLYGNETQISQMIMNLVINAFQVLEETGGKVTVSTYIAHDQIHIRVEDNGPGIPREQMKKVFDPFFTTKPIGQGTGLGLAIVSQVVEEHHGVIDLESREGEGTRFTIFLPVTEAEEPLK